MKYNLIALAAASLVGSVAARGHAHHKRHENLHESHSSECQPAECTTVVTSYLVDVEYPMPTYVSNITDTPPPTALPEPETTVCPTPGIYTFPEKTITLTNTEYICTPSHTQLAPGTQTYGGITTVVQTSTTLVCPVPTVVTEEDKVTTKIVQTTYVCPTPGTYTLAPITKTLTEIVDCDYPVITSYPPGTYTQPAYTTTVTSTNVVVTCPYYTSTSVVSVVPVPKETYPPEPVPKYEPPKEEEEKPKPKPAPKKGGDLAPHKGTWSITYSPYAPDGQCKSGETIENDIKDIADRKFTNVRIYAPDCDSLKYVGNACEKYGLKITLGVFIKAGGVHTADTQVEDIIKWGKWNLVELFVVGNEAIFQGFCTNYELAEYIKEVSRKLREAGYGGPITTTEPLATLQEFGDAICDVVDVIGCNLHPFFNPTVSCDQAGPFLKGQLELCEKVCGKKGYVLEAGWPERGSPNGKAIPGESEQLIAIKSIVDSCDVSRVTFFSYEVDEWKQDGPFGVEKYFDCGKLFPL